MLLYHSLRWVFLSRSVLYWNMTFGAERFSRLVIPWISASLQP